MLHERLGTVFVLELLDKARIPDDVRSSVSGMTFTSGTHTKLTHHSSLAIPRSLQHLMRALDLQASVAVGTPDGSKYSCSPLAIATSLLGKTMGGVSPNETVGLCTRQMPLTGQDRRDPILC
jgi:hypothetical protein